MLLSTAMRSNAGMANRQVASLRPPPQINTLAWLVFKGLKQLPALDPCTLLTAFFYNVITRIQL